MGFAEQGLKELIPLEVAYGRILAEDLVADHDVPSFNRSPMMDLLLRQKILPGQVMRIQSYLK